MSKIVLVTGVFLLAIACSNNKDSKIFNENRFITDSYSQGQSNIILQGNTLFALSAGSFQTFSIKNNKLDLISETLIQNNPCYFFINNGYAFVTTRANEVLVINIEKPESPFIKDTLSLPGTYTSFNNGKSVIIQTLKNNYTWETFIYNTKENKLLDGRNVPRKYWPLLNLSNNFYGINGRDSIFVFRNFPMDEHQTADYCIPWSKSSYPFTIKTINNSILVRGDGTTGITIIRLESNGRYKELSSIDFKASGFDTNGNYLIAHNISRINLYDISVPEKPIILDSIDDKTIADLEFNGTDLIYSTSEGQIKHFRFNNNYFDPIGSFERNGVYIYGEVSNSNIILFTGLRKIILKAIDPRDSVKNPYIKQINYSPLSICMTDSLIMAFGYNSNKSGYINQILRVNADSVEEISMTCNIKTPILYNKHLGLYSLISDTLKLFSEDHGTLIVKSEKIIKNTRMGIIYPYQNHYYVVSDKGFAIYNDLDGVNPEPIKSFNHGLNEVLEACFVDSLLILGSKYQNSGTHVFNISNVNNVRLVKSINDYGYIMYDKGNGKIYIANRNGINSYNISGKEMFKREKSILNNTCNDLVNVKLITEKGGKSRLVLVNSSDVKFINLN